MSSGSSYTYTESLAESEIRILKVLPGAFGTLICCDLMVVTSQHLSMPYTALSYTWGDPTLDKTILMNGKRHAVTTNLYDALRYLRRDEEPLHIWIDAVCINQNDLLEKTAQVRNMDRVYKRAASTVIWLGPPRDGLHDALENTIQLGRLEKTAENVERYYPSFKDIFARPWFARLWVMQEVVLSRKCIAHCGHESCSFEELAEVPASFSWDFQSSQVWSDVDPGFTDALSGNLTQLRLMLSTATAVNGRGGGKWPFSLLGLLQTARGRLCQDARDRYFGLVGVLGSREDMVAVDYEVDVVRLFSRVTAEGLKECQGVGQLCYFHGETQGCPDAENATWEDRLLSWVPQWVAWRERLPFNPNLYDASAGLFAPDYGANPFSGNFTQLTVQGHVVSKIVASFSRNTAVDAPTLTNLADAVLEACTESLKSDVEIVESCARTMVADTWESPGSSPQRQRWPSDDALLLCKPWRSEIDSIKAVEQAVTEEHYDVSRLKQYWAVFQDMARTHLGGRTFQMTVDGRFVLAPAHSRLGDVVAVLADAPMPFLLRARVGRDTYEMVGPAYVHGVMDGEVGEALIREGRRLSTIVID